MKQEIQFCTLTLISVFSTDYLYSYNKDILTVQVAYIHYQPLQEW